MLHLNQCLITEVNQHLPFIFQEILASISNVIMMVVAFMTVTLSRNVTARKDTKESIVKNVSFSRFEDNWIEKYLLIFLQTLLN